MNTLLTREELELQKIYREYAEERVRPHTLEIDRGQFDVGILIHEMHKLGFCGIVIPEEYGGLGSSYVHYVLAVEALARASGPVAKSVSGQTNMCFPILKYGTEAQKQKYVVPWVRGDKTSAFTLTEPGAGSDAASIQTSAVLKDGQYIVNGTKAFITGAREADFFQTYCQFRDAAAKRSRCACSSTSTSARASPSAGTRSSWACAQNPWPRSCSTTCMCRRRTSWAG